jgi:hypothetical protein
METTLCWNVPTAGAVVCIYLPVDGSLAEARCDVWAVLSYAGVC